MFVILGFLGILALFIGAFVFLVHVDSNKVPMSVILPTVGTVVIGGFFALMFLVVIPGIRSTDRSQCMQYGRDTGQEVRFVEHGQHWVCYAKHLNGWVLVFNDFNDLRPSG